MVKTEKQTKKVKNPQDKKKVHLNFEQIRQKIQKLQIEVKSPEVQSNKTKKKRIYGELAKLNNALKDPQNKVIDPQEELARIQQQKQRRIQKKIDKKRQLVLQVKKQKRYQKCCLKCGSRQHPLSECPTNQAGGSGGGGFCYKCGSAEHNHRDCDKETYDLADCFYCGQRGHIARECPKNDKGLYRKGGSCFGCGSVRHTLKDCPVRNAAKSGSGQGTGTWRNDDEGY